MTEPATEPRRINNTVTETPTSYVREGADAHPPLDYEPYKSTRLRRLVYPPQTLTEITGRSSGRRGFSASTAMT